jgi:hypothetical protein
MARYGLRLLVSTLAVLLLPPFIAAAIVPLALLLFPVAWLAIPFIVATLLGDSLAAGVDAKPKRVVSVSRISTKALVHATPVGLVK